MVGSKDLSPSTSPFFPKEFFKNQFRSPVRHVPHDTDLSGQVAIVTGANTGLGFEAASQLLSHGLGFLILAVRSSAKGGAAAEQLSKQHPNAKVEVWILDMGSYDSIQLFSQKVNTELTRLDIVILNAGVGNVTYKTAPSTAHEEIVQVNYLSTTLLALLLLPTLKLKSTGHRPGRLTMIGSALALTPNLLPAAGQPILPSIDEASTFNAGWQYGRSKLFNQMFLWKLVNYISADKVIVNMVDPGLVKGTELGRGLHGLPKAFMAVFSAVAAKSVKEGAATYLDAVVTKGENSHGMFIIGYEYHPFNPALYGTAGKQAIEELWKETMNELSFAKPSQLLTSLRD